MMKRGTGESTPQSLGAGRTSAGISRALLTPCRRLGLSRKRYAVSPLALATCSPHTPSSCSADILASALTLEGSTQNSIVTEQNKNLILAENASTPTRPAAHTNRRKFKKLISLTPTPTTLTPEKTFAVFNEEDSETGPSYQASAVKKPSNSIDPIANGPKMKAANKKIERQDDNEITVDVNVVPLTRKKSTPKQLKKQNSINLARKCVVVINKRVLKDNADSSNRGEVTKANVNNKSMQFCTPSRKDETTLSDLDDVPLSNLSANKTMHTDQINDFTAKKRPRTLILDEDDTDFCDESLNSLSNKIKKLETSNHSNVVKLESVKNKKSSSRKEPRNGDNQSQRSIRAKDISKEFQGNKDHLNPENSSYEDDDDFDCRKTILIRKSYRKVDMQKAKSTGSITQKDIDDITLRIKMKQNALLAKSGGHNITELTELIKKWRKGCQEALIELLDIMKRKIPNKDKMNTLELLKMLNIPPALVDYNSEDDIFISRE